MDRKNLYIIIIVLAGMLIAGGLAWFLFFRTAPEEAAAPPKEAGFTLPEMEAAGKLKVLTREPIVAASLDKNTGRVLFYDFSGKLGFINADGSSAESAGPPVKDLAGVIFSPGALSGAVKIGRSQADSRYSFFDSQSGSLNALRSGIKSLAVAPDGRSIVYQVSSGLTNSLFTSSTDGRNQRTLISSLGLRDVFLSWPQTTKISLASRPSGRASGSLWVLNTRTLSFSRLIDGLGLEALWSPQGGNLIYSYVEQAGGRPKLAALDSKGNTRAFDISASAGKCVWSSETVVFCAVPKVWPGGAVLPDDYYSRKFLTSDDLFKINIETGSKSLVASGLGDVSNPLISSAEDSLIFILRNNGLLYRLNLR